MRNDEVEDEFHISRYIPFTPVSN